MCVFTDGPDYQTVLGSIDSAFLFAYAIGMFIRYYCQLLYEVLIVASEIWHRESYAIESVDG